MLQITHPIKHYSIPQSLNDNLNKAVLALNKLQSDLNINIVESLEKNNLVKVPIFLFLRLKLKNNLKINH